MTKIPRKILPEGPQPASIFSCKNITDEGLRREVSTLMCIVGLLWDSLPNTPSLHGKHPTFSELMQYFKKEVDRVSDEQK